MDSDCSALQSDCCHPLGKRGADHPPPEPDKPDQRDGRIMNVIKPHGQRFIASLNHNFDTTKQDRFKTQYYGSRDGLTGQQRGQRFIERKPPSASLSQSHLPFKAERTANLSSKPPPVLPLPTSRNSTPSRPNLVSRWGKKSNSHFNGIKRQPGLSLRRTATTVTGSKPL